MEKNLVLYPRKYRTVPSPYSGRCCHGYGPLSLSGYPANPLYTGGLFHCYMLDESVILGVSGICCCFYSILFANNVDPDQMPHNVASEMGLHYLPMTLLWASR